MPNEMPKMPGGPVAYSSLYETRVDQESGKEVGIKTPEGQWYPFTDGEGFAQIKLEGISDRLPVIKLKDGRMISFEEWEESQNPKQKRTDVATQAPTLPGGPVSYTSLYETKVKTEGTLMTSLGVRTPSGEWFVFDKGEEFVQVRAEGVSDRLPAIKQQDGKIISFAQWKSEQPKKEEGIA